MAGRPCTVCKHPKRREIDQLLAQQSVSMRDIASQFNLGRNSVGHHAQTHIAPLVTAAQAELAERAVAENGVAAKSVVERIATLVDTAYEAVAYAKSLSLDPGADEQLRLKALDRVFAGVGQLHGILKTLGQANGEIPTGATQVNVLVVREVEKVQREEWSYQADMVNAAIDVMAGGGTRQAAQAAAWQARERAQGGVVVETEGEVIQ